MQKILKNRYFVIGLSVAVVIALMAGSFYFGYRQGAKNPQTIIVHGVANLEQGKLEAVDFSLFWDAWQAIKDKYVKAGEINNQDLVYGAISGLVGALKDPNSVFFPPSDAKKFSQDISGEFSGIGARIDTINNQLVVVAPLKNSPAEQAGLRAGDKILKIDQTATANLNTDEAVKLIRGKEGTTVVLTILRDSWDKPKEISIVRQTIQVPTLDWEIKDNNIAYIHLYNFYETAPLLFYQAVHEIALKNPRALVLDLRDNPGGYLDAAVNLAGWFLKPGEIVVSEEFRSGEKQIFKAYGSGLLKDAPIVILINEGSASASEILAGALKDDRGIKLIGKKSFGKGTVQEIDNLKDNSMIKITIAHWRMPAGTLIDKNGITPDYEVNLTDEDIKAGKDPQLDKALEVLREML